MWSRAQGEKLDPWYREAVAAFGLAICLGASPLLARQNQQNQQAEPDQQDQQAPPAQPGATVRPAPDQPAQSPAATPQTPDQPAPEAPNPLPATLTVPRGTLITVRVSQLLSSNRNVPGDTFSAEMEQPLVIDGWVVSRRGQTVLGRVAVAKKAGRVKGVSQLGVELSQLVLVDGQQLSVHTQLLQHSGGTSRGRDAQAIGTTTGIGAVIGAATEGGEGAGIGAGIGAAAGVAGVLLTRGRPTIIPPETSLTFQLQSPLTIPTGRGGPAFRPATDQDYERGPLRHRRPRLAGPPPPPYYWGASPWGFYPGPLFFGYYGFGRGFGRGGFRR